MFIVLGNGVEVAFVLFDAFDLLAQELVDPLEILLHLLVLYLPVGDEGVALSFDPGVDNLLLVLQLGHLGVIQLLEQSIERAFQVL